MRRALLVLGVLVALGVGTAGLLLLATTGATVFETRDGGRTLHIEGPITGAGTERFQRLLEQTPGLRTVTLGDLPGTDDVTWLLSIGYQIRAAGLDTVAVGALDNDAILLHLAGVSRRVEEGGRFRITDADGARQLGLPHDRRAVSDAERRAYIVAMTGSDGFADALDALRSDAGGDIVTLGAAEIARFGLVTD